MADASSKFDAITIGEAAKRVGLTPRAIRYYERIGLIEGALRSSRNYRLYDDTALHELRAIARCRAIGMPIAEIRSLCSGTPFRTEKDQSADLLCEQLKLTEARIRDLISVRRELRRQIGAKTSDPKQGESASAASRRQISRRSPLTR